MHRLLAPTLALCLLATPALADDSNPDAAWEETLEQVIPAVVSLRMAAPRAFDTESARTSGATGFVVDAERGILLTNRHVVQPGPVVAEAIFSHQEEVPVFPLYRDPVHDFGFYRFDPEALRFSPDYHPALADHYRALLGG